MTEENKPLTPLQFKILGVVTLAAFLALVVLFATGKAKIYSFRTPVCPYVCEECRGYMDAYDTRSAWVDVLF